MTTNARTASTVRTNAPNLIVMSIFIPSSNPVLHRTTRMRADVFDTHLRGRSYSSNVTLSEMNGCSAIDDHPFGRMSHKVRECKPLHYPGVRDNEAEFLLLDI